MVAIEECEAGLGVFARRNIRRGGHILSFEGRSLTLRRRSGAVISSRACNELHCRCALPFWIHRFLDGTSGFARQRPALHTILREDGSMALEMLSSKHERAYQAAPETGRARFSTNRAWQHGSATEARAGNDSGRSCHRPAVNAG